MDTDRLIKKSVGLLDDHEIAFSSQAGLRPQASASQIHQRPVFHKLLFSQCWEDPELDFQALRVRRGQTILSVTSGGCNTLSLATRGPEKIYAIDLNPAQNWLLELKIAGARRLDHGEYLELLGVRTSDRRRALYRRLRGDLSREAGSHWDQHLDDLDKGVLNTGRYERYLAMFRFLLRLLQGEKRIARLFTLDGPGRQQEFYDREWDNRAWRLFFRIFFSRKVLGHGGLDPSFFKYLEEDVSFGDQFLARARHALTRLPIQSNYFLSQICLGRYLNEESVPPYLQRRNFAALKQACSRIEPVTQELGSFLASLPDNSIDGFNYSNVFEWVPEETFVEMLRQTHRVARPQARLCYRNLLVRRRHPESLDSCFQPEDELATELLSRDRSFVYAHFEVAEVLKSTEGGV